MFPFDLTKRRGERGVVGVNLVLVIAFALYAVIMLSRTTLAAKQIDDRVRVIVTEGGRGPKVSRLDETQKLKTIGKTAGAILAAARPRSGQAQEIICPAKSIASPVSASNANASEINATVHSINATAAALLPVVQNIHGDDSLSPQTGGVSAINQRAEKATPVVSGISTDLLAVFGDVGAGGTGGHSGNTIHRHVNSINCALTSPIGGLVGTLGSLLNGLSGAPTGCNAF